MKSLVLVASLALSTQSYAATVCSAAYAAGINHVMKGMSLPLGDKEAIKAGEKSQDKLYTVSFSKDEKVTLQETQSGKEVKLSVSSPVPEMKIFASPSLKLYPEGVPGAIDANHKFVIVVCADESNL